MISINGQAITGMGQPWGHLIQRASLGRYWKFAMMDRPQNIQSKLGHIRTSESSTGGQECMNSSKSTSGDVPCVKRTKFSLSVKSQCSTLYPLKKTPSLSRQ